MLVILIVVVLFLIYLSYNGSLPGSDCGCTERMAYLPKGKERMAAIPPPQFKRMKGVERFTTNRETANQPYSASDYQNTKRERFSDDFNYPPVAGMSMQATAQSPFIGSLY